MSITVKANSTTPVVFEIVSQTANGTAYAAATATDLNPNNLLLDTNGPKVTSDSLGMRRSRIKFQLRDSVKTGTCAESDCELKHSTVELSTSFPVAGDPVKLMEQLYSVAEMLKDESFVTSMLINGRTQYSDSTIITPDASA